MGIKNENEKFATAFQDLCLWILLNIATRMAVTGDVKLLDMLLVILFTLVFKFFLSTPIQVLNPDENIKNTSPNW